MPRYDYRCATCGQEFEVVQSFHEPALTHCPHCDSEGLRKVFGSVGVVFKGSGFYRTDSRESDKNAKGKSSASAGKSGDKTTEKATSSGADKTAGSGKASADSTSGTGSTGAAKAGAGKGAK